MCLINENNKVVKILVSRDNLSVREAISIVAYCAEAIYDAVAVGDSPEEVIMGELGLEPDYIFDIIDLY